MAVEPKLRTVEKSKPLYPMNDFPKDFALNLGKEVVYLLASRGASRLEGSDWEEIFSRLIDAEWKPSNVGLDDIVKGQMAWGAKTIKNKKPASVSKIRLISGRNSPVYSFGDKTVSECDANELGGKVLSIWNERVSAIRQLYKHVRTVVLVKSDDLLELSVFEFETVMYLPENYWWQWNERNNLEGYQRNTNEHIFTWQPHGSQFTIIENVPNQRLAIKLRQPPLLDRTQVLEALNFDESWVQVLDTRS
ncbi:hypothetical protein [Thiothrix sp.]|jgi:hypothetical protein|uniref:hypothetical protein n=1 Tax=Thiothrix sp. TaxID=1032 RepID=UPI00257F014D|nr:hypothetical protein [Thiothrix sp.]